MCLAVPGMAALRRHRLGAGAESIGVVPGGRQGMVTTRTAFGITRVVDMVAGDQLPRVY